MDNESAKVKIEDALGKETIIMFARCEVYYSGRAESFLAEGDRIIIIKQDRTLLIHQPKNSMPINYMKEETEYTITTDNKELRIKARNKKYKEDLEVIIRKMYFLKSKNLEDNQRLIIKGTERDMADMIMNNPKLISKEFKPLSREEHTKYGFIDVFGYDSKGNLIVIETKRYVGDLKAVSQLRRYVERIKAAKGIKNVKGILACPRITPNAEKMLHDFGFEYKRVLPPKYLENERRKQKKIFEFKK